MKTVKWGVIGAGGIADRRTLPGMMLAKNAQLIAVNEINQTFAETLCKKYNAKRAYDNVDDIIADKEVEAIYIATPVIYHKEAAIKASKEGKHVFLEKPIALNFNESQEVLRTVRKCNVKFGIGFQMRFHNLHQKIKSIIQKGDLGQIVYCRAQLTCWYPDMPGSWRQKYELSGGGSLMDMGVHCIDLLQYLLNSHVNAVSCFNGTNTFNYEVEDSCSLLLSFDNKAYGTVDTFFNIPDDAAEQRLEIYGTKGSVLCSGTIGQVEAGKAYLCLSDQGEYIAQQNRLNVNKYELEAGFGNIYTKEIEAFSECILNDLPEPIPAEDGLQVQKIIESAYTAAKEKKTIEITF